MPLFKRKEQDASKAAPASPPGAVEPPDAVDEEEDNEGQLVRPRSAMLYVEDAELARQEEVLAVASSFKRRGSFFVPPEAALSDEECGGASSGSEGETFSGSAPEASSMDTSPEPKGATSNEEKEPILKHAIACEFEEEDFDFGRDGGKVWIAQVLPDDCSDRRFLDDKGNLKQRRAVPIIRARDLLAGLRQQADGRWMFLGPLNGWPGLVNLELLSIARKRKFMNFQTSLVKRVWSAGSTSPPPESIRKGRFCATFRMASWSRHGWSADSPGFVWWFIDRPRSEGVKPQCLFGERIVKYMAEEDEFANASIRVLHAFAHRYPVLKETLADRNTWHTGLFLEWSHGKFGTVIELAYLNGCGGYGGKSNWCVDKLEPVTELFKAMDDSLKAPWDTNLAEIRVIDVGPRDKREFEEYLNMYSNFAPDLPLAQRRFVDPKVYASSHCRLRMKRQADVAGYLLNYIHRAFAYEKLTANCQTFTADFYSFLAGARDVQPYGSIVKPGYKQRSHSFLYEPRREDA